MGTSQAYTKPVTDRYMVKAVESQGRRCKVKQGRKVWLSIQTDGVGLTSSYGP